MFPAATTAQNRSKLIFPMRHEGLQNHPPPRDKSPRIPWVGFLYIPAEAPVEDAADL